jgi:H+-transporting ATPase
MCLILFLYDILHLKKPALEALSQVLVLLIAAIPVGMQTVLSVTMAVGASQLAKKSVIVKRLTSIEELASVSILCSGNLTFY